MQIKQQVKQILDHNWFFPIVLLNYGLFYILFAEKYALNEGFGTDGYVYKTFVTDLTQSVFYDSYFIHRVFPSFVIRFIMDLFSLDLSSLNIFQSFEILNLLSVVSSAYFIKKILVLLNIDLRHQLLAFTLLFMNFGLLKWPYYFPVMLDTVAFALGVMLLYFYLKNNTVGMIILTMIFAFTWPMGYYQGLLLLAFPYQKIEFVPFSKWPKMVIYALSALLFIAAFVFIVLIKKGDTHLTFVPKIDRHLLPLSVLVITMIYIAFAQLVLNSNLFNLQHFFRSLNYPRIILAALSFLTVSLFIKYLNLPDSTIYQTSSILENPVIHSLVRPFFTVVTHFTFFGIGICLLLFYWKKFSKAITQSGRGLVGAFVLNLYLFGIVPESRVLVNLFPWIIIFLIVAISKINFSNTFYFVIAALSFLSSRIWLIIDLKMDSSTDANGSIDFPSQLFYMNIGPWMSEKAYYIMGTTMLLSLLILFFTLYKINFSKNNNTYIERRF